MRYWLQRTDTGVARVAYWRDRVQTLFGVNPEAVKGLLTWSRRNKQPGVQLHASLIIASVCKIFNWVSIVN